jgi:hypothetical protein
VARKGLLNAIVDQRSATADLHGTSASVLMERALLAKPTHGNKIASRS